MGGDHLEAALDRMNVWGRIPLCGAISGYNEETPPPGPRNFLAVLPKRLTIRGFIILDHFDRYRDFQAEVGPLVADGQDLLPRDRGRGHREHAATRSWACWTARTPARCW